MAAETKRTRPAKKKRRRRPPEEIVDYIVEIDGWDWGYSFSLNKERQPIDPYHEFRHLQVKGRLLRPTGLKTERTEISLLPSSDLEEERRKDLTPLALGSLSTTGDAILGNIGIPWDALTSIMQMLITANKDSKSERNGEPDVSAFPGRFPFAGPRPLSLTGKSLELTGPIRRRTTRRHPRCAGAHLRARRIHPAAKTTLK